jgi:beta-glucanase (GH16 family)
MPFLHLFRYKSAQSMGAGGVGGATVEDRQPSRARLNRKLQVLGLLPICATAAVLAATVPSNHSAGTSEKRPDAIPVAGRVTATPDCCRQTHATPSNEASATARQPPPDESISTTRSNADLGIDPSGVPMPTGNLSGWRLVYSQNFNGNSLPEDWDAYSEEPGNDPYGWWDRKNVTVSGGELHFGTTANDDLQRVGTYSTGGIGYRGNPQTYGMYLVRLKGDYEPNLKMSDIALLWPSDAKIWPPEMDFFEDQGGKRESFIATLHPGPNTDDCCAIREEVTNVATQWHTYGVSWTPTTITYSIDGKQWGSAIRKSQLTSPAQWPSMNMDLDLQSQNLSSAQPSRPIETMTVDWVVEYAMDS